jgi:NTP pyrophosphatase (non-canonical NTP hydrolase)
MREPLLYFSEKEDQPPFLKALAEVRRIGAHEGWCFQHLDLTFSTSVSVVVLVAGECLARWPADESQWSVRFM